MSEITARKEILKKVKSYCKLYHKPYETENIHYAKRLYDYEEMVNLVDASLDFWLTAGRYTDRFEGKFAEFLGIRKCLFVNSGSSANLLAFMTLTSPLLGDRAIKRGDEVITVAAAFPTTVAPMVQFGANPVFVDVTIPQYNINTRLLDVALTKKTKAVMLAHTMGNPFDLNVVKEFCDKNNLWLIEDNCDSLGSSYRHKGKWRYTGTIGDIGTSSFYPSHHMTTGEGGMVYTNNKLLYKIALSLRDWGRACSCPSGIDNSCGKRFDGQFGQLPKGYDHKYVYSHLGYNLRATEMQAAIGCAQLKKLPEFIEKRRDNWWYMRKKLEGLDLILPEPAINSNPSWFGFLITVNHGRDKIVRHLESMGIQTRMLFSGNILKQPCCDNFIMSGGELTNTDIIMNNSFWIGIYPGITKKNIDYMVREIGKVVGRK
jgi:CDP-6-deoxy-D-xylo-4-hexulose-3-dehydrase